MLWNERKMTINSDKTNKTDRAQKLEKCTHVS